MSDFTSQQYLDLLRGAIERVPVSPRAEVVQLMLWAHANWREGS